MIKKIYQDRFSEGFSGGGFDWFKFLAQTKISDDEWDDADGLASKWPTCACGNLCKMIPRTWLGCPIDDQLEDLGNYFANAVGDRDKKAALIIMKDIEKRADQVIKEITKKKSRRDPIKKASH